jgi:hypothetical protein
MADTEKVLRAHLMSLLRGGNAHLTFDAAVAHFPPKLRGVKPEGQAHTAWSLLEHLRIAQWDILDFCRNPKYKELKFPEDYWPRHGAPPSETAWEKSIKAFRADLGAMEKLVASKSTDLFAPIEHGNGQTILREALLVADHNAYHLGQLVSLRRALGAWKDH